MPLAVSEADTKLLPRQRGTDFAKSDAVGLSGTEVEFIYTVKDKNQTVPRNIVAKRTHIVRSCGTVHGNQYTRKERSLKNVRRPVHFTGFENVDFREIHRRFVGFELSSGIQSVSLQCFQCRILKLVLAHPLVRFGTRRSIRIRNKDVKMPSSSKQQ